MPTADFYDALDPRADPVAEEAKALLVRARSCITYAKEACKLEEEWRDVEERRLDAWRKREAAMKTQARIQDKIGLWLLLVVALAANVLANAIYLANWLL